MRQILLLLAAIVAICSSAPNASALELQADVPTYRGGAPGKFRLDVCFLLGRNCGQDAADKYCQIHGMQRAIRFETERVSPTQTLVGQRCDGPHCTAFRKITCFTSGERGPNTRWPQIID